jgi:hypothetical protein
MILKTLLGLSLLVGAAIDGRMPGGGITPDGAEAALHMSPRQKIAAVRPLVRSATDCVAQAVAADPRFPHADAVLINELIADSMPSCVDAMRAMMDAYDRYFGAGMGETFFTGPYLDVLPRAVHRVLQRGVDRTDGDPQE